MRRLWEAGEYRVQLHPQRRTGELGRWQYPRAARSLINPPHCALLTTSAHTRRQQSFDSRLTTTRARRAGVADILFLVAAIALAPLVAVQIQPYM